MTSLINIVPSITLWPLALLYLYSLSSSLPLLLFNLFVQLFATPWTHQAFLSVTISWCLLKFMSIELVMPSNHLILFFSCLQPFPESGSFPMSQLFTSGGQSIQASASASVLAVNIQGCSIMYNTSPDDAK